MGLLVPLLVALLPLTVSFQIPLQHTFSASKNVLLPPKIDQYIASQLSYWNSSGLAVAVVKKDESTGTWTTEFGSYGQAHANGAPVTPDTVFAIASDSKLFLSMGVGLLIKNESLARRRGETLRWDTKIATLLPEWGLMDEEMQNGVTIQDMLSHRTGLPRHDYSGQLRERGVSEMVGSSFVPWFGIYFYFCSRYQLSDTFVRQLRCASSTNTTTSCTRLCHTSSRRS